VVAQPAQALEEVDVCHVLAKKRHPALVLEDLQLHEVGDDIADVTQEDEPLEDCQYRLSPRKVLLVPELAIFLGDDEDPIESKEPSELADLAPYLFERL
jgi:hypothetical protein